ncbi:hypothetical protein AAE478_002594 [Parahypoxylon ruwenzoriense]
MVSRFVSGGVIAGDGDEPQTAPTSASPPKAVKWGDKDDGEASRKRNAEWEAVQRDLDADRRRREEARRAQVEGGGGGESRSLYDILQANKAAKQAAFEEQNRIRNQFRALDDDEIEFLDGVRDERRTEEERVRRETEERLARFREAQRAAGRNMEAAEGGDGGGDGEDAAAEWAAAGAGPRKRKRESRGIVRGVKRRTSEAEKEVETMPLATIAGVKDDAGKAKTETEMKATPVAASTDTGVSADKPKPQPKPKLGLVDYGSDEDDDD